MVLGLGASALFVGMLLEPSRPGQEAILNDQPCGNENYRKANTTEKADDRFETFMVGHGDWPGVNCKATADREDEISMALIGDEEIRKAPLVSTVLTTAQIETFLADGVVVVDDILDQDQLESARRGLKESLHGHGIDTDELLATGVNLSKLSSTNGSGGVLDLVYDDWKMNVAMNERLFQATTELWRASFCHKGERRENLVDASEAFKWHPFGSFDCNRGYVYMDRVGFRIPTDLAEQLGRQLQSNLPQKKSKSKTFPIQRCLTPHLDCCPETFLFAGGQTKWRPIQCMVSLTDNLEANTGGFEAAKGFHREFEQWSASRPPSAIVGKTKDGMKESLVVPAPCVGEYTHIRPIEDADILRRIQHVPVKAGSAVFWDNRLPHANAYRHDGPLPRCVVYCSFLPDIPINRTFAAQQLSHLRQGLPLVDTKWMEADESCRSSSTNDLERWLEGLTLKQRRLLGVDDWR